MAQRATKKFATDDDLLKLPEHLVGIYAREGVAWSWLIDPLGRTLEAYRVEQGLWVQLGAWSEADSPRVAPFDAIELQLEARWSPVPD